ncbi:MAG: amino acid permease, partial [Clostridium argentinense]|nr:amino acid permease [Clostridium argentinense]
MKNSNKSQKRKMGLFAATALVVGNMIGSGIFMLPTTLANAAGPGATLIAWLITGIGSVFIALSFAHLGRIIPKTGGPYEYSKEAFGEFIGFANAWLYWIGSVIGNAAVIIAIGSYFSGIFPTISNNHLVGFLFCSAVLWGLTFINVRGVRLTGNIASVITVFKLSVLLIFIAVAGVHFDLTNITPMFPKGEGVKTLSAAATVTLWGFIGLESSSIAAGDIENPKENVAKSTIFGILLACLFYLALSFFAMGAMPQSEIAKSTAPISDILTQYFGKGIINFINISIVISIIGTAIGWIFSSARIAYAAGEDGIFPKIFSVTHEKYGTPYKALILSSVITNLVLILNFSNGFVGALNIITLIATAAYLPIYAITIMSDLVIMRRQKILTKKHIIKKSIVPIMGIIYVAWAIYGSGLQTVFYVVLLVIFGTPIYVYLKVSVKVLAPLIYLKIVLKYPSKAKVGFTRINLFL